MLINGINTEVKGEGDPIVFIHGFTTTSKFWQHQVPEFSKTHQVVVLDLPGHGDSLKDVDGDYTVPGFARSVFAVLDHLKIAEAVLVGLSMGGTVVQEMYSKQPTRVRALVLAGTTSHGLGPAVQAESVLSRIKAIGVAPASQEVIEKSFAATTSRDLVMWAKAEVSKTPGHVADPAIRSLNAFDSRSWLHNVHVPTLIVVGREDGITPVQESVNLSNKILGSKLVIVDGAAHFPMLERPTEFNGALRAFLAEKAQPGSTGRERTAKSKD